MNAKNRIGTLAALVATMAALTLATPAPAAVQNVTYTYDALGRITSAIYDSTWVVEWTWDPNGNLLARESHAFTVAVEEPAAPGLEFALGRAVPNPFHGTTAIRFAVPRESRIELVVYDLSGRRVRTLARGSVAAGEHAAVWNGRDDAGAPAPSGVYFYRLDAGAFSATRRLAFVR